MNKIVLFIVPRVFSMNGACHVVFGENFPVIFRFFIVVMEAESQKAGIVGKHPTFYSLSIHAV